MTHQSDRRSFESYVEEPKPSAEQHGHMNLRENENEESLHLWRRNQRAAYNKMIQDNNTTSMHNKIAPHKIRYDFNFRPRDHKKTFESFVQELKMYIEKHGHMKVKKGENKSLSGWIRRVRFSYRNDMQKRTVSSQINLTPDRMKVLEDIGFVFDASTQKPTFESHVQELKMYIEEHGHMKVKNRENRSLQKWISDVRLSYKLILKGRKPKIKLTPDRIKMLEVIGFEFFKPPERVENGNGASIGRYQSFESRVQELKMYMEKHGHMKVKEEEENTSLYYWIKNVRQSYRDMQKGTMARLPIKLTPDRMKLLHNIGFDFHNTIGKSTQTQTERDSYAKRQRDDASGCSEAGHELGVATEFFTDSDTYSFNCSMDDEHSSKRQKIDFNTDQSLLPENKNGRTNDNDCVENDSISIEQEEELPVAQNLQSSRATTTTTVHNNALPIPVSRDSCCVPSKCRYYGHEYNLDHDQSFESSVQELERYIEKHGHMKVAKEENKALHLWIKNVRSSYRNIQEGSNQGPPSIELTPDRMKMLGHIGFEFETDVHGWYKQLNFRRDEDLYCRQDEDLEEQEGQTFEASEATNDHEYQEGENEEIIDGDVIPRWLLIFNE